MEDAGFEPGTSASEVWRASNEPPHPRIWILQFSPQAAGLIIDMCNTVQAKMLQKVLC